VDRERFRAASAQEVDRVRRRFGVEAPYLLFVGGIEPRKNLPALVRAYAGLPDGIRPRLVLVGASVPWNPEGQDALDAALLALADRARRGIVRVDYVGERDKVALYTGAEALVLPSLYEGFGFPVLEAMACGTPVVTSNLSSLPEVSGGDAVLVDPRDEGSIREGIRQILEDEGIRDRLHRAGPERAARFTWEESARRTAEILHRAAPS
jgi:glycosyltransferase involved in cell wall biosynthesis